jgi:hypothetical protein
MKRLPLLTAASLLLAFSSMTATADDAVKQGVDDAGHGVKEAGKATGRGVETAGKATGKAAVKTGSAIKRVSKRVAHATADKVGAGADKVKDKTN